MKKIFKQKLKDVYTDLGSFDTSYDELKDFRKPKWNKIYNYRTHLIWISVLMIFYLVKNLL